MLQVGGRGVAHARREHSLDLVVDDDGVRRSEQGLHATWDLGELHPRDFEDLLKVLVTVDVLPLIGVLQLIGLWRGVEGRGRT